MRLQAHHRSVFALVRHVLHCHEWPAYAPPTKEEIVQSQPALHGIRAGWRQCDAIENGYSTRVQFLPKNTCTSAGASRRPRCSRRRPGGQQRRVSSLQLRQGFSAGVAAVGRGSHLDQPKPAVGGHPADHPALKGAEPEVIRAIFMPGGRFLSQSEVIRAILLDDSPCCGGCPHRELRLVEAAADDGAARPLEQQQSSGQRQATVLLDDSPCVRGD